MKSVADIRRVILIDWATYFDHLVNAKNQLILGNGPYHSDPIQKDKWRKAILKEHRDMDSRQVWRKI